MNIYLQLALILLMLFGSGFFSAAEMSLSSANRLRLDNAAEEDEPGARAACIIYDRFEDTLSAILIGNNLCNIGSDSLVTAIITVTLARPGLTPVSTVLMTLIIITFCESMPKILAKKNATRWTMAFAPFLRALTVLLTPAVWLVTKLIHLLTLPFPGEKLDEDDDERAAAELQSIIETVEDEGVIDEDRGELMRSALDFSEIPVMDVMTARVDMFALDADDSWEEQLAGIESASFSRIPVYADSVDNIIGVLYLNHFYKRLLETGGESFDLRELLLPPEYVYKTVRLPDVLNTLRRKQRHLAVVTDEFGGTLGIVTMEDVLEQIVGEIWDENDVVEEDVCERSDGALELDGSVPLTDVPELLELPEELFEEAESSTVGGWTIECFGRFPHVGDRFVRAGRSFTVLQMSEDGRRVERVLAERI